METYEIIEIEIVSLRRIVYSFLGFRSQCLNREGKTGEEVLRKRRIKGPQGEKDKGCQIGRGGKEDSHDTKCHNSLCNREGKEKKRERKISPKNSLAEAKKKKSYAA